jgi:hypothetical protein
MTLFARMVFVRRLCGAILVPICLAANPPQIGDLKFPLEIE